MTQKKQNIKLNKTFLHKNKPRVAGNFDMPLQLFLTLYINAAACQNSFFCVLCLSKFGWGEKTVNQEYQRNNVDMPLQ
jgi:hypothetical protein